LEMHTQDTVMISYIMAKFEYSESKYNDWTLNAFPTMLSRQQMASTPDRVESGRNPTERIVSEEIAG